MPVLGWLRDHVHCLGARLEVPALVRHATGKPLRVTAYLVPQAEVPDHW